MIVATAISLISLLLSVIAILLSLRSIYYTRRQTEIMEEKREQKRHEDESTAEWAAKFDEAVSAILKIEPYWIETKSAKTNAFGLAFPDSAVQQRIENSLVEGKFGRGLRARQMGSDQLRLPSVQQTITEALDCVRKFKQAWPDDAKKLGL